MNFVPCSCVTYSKDVFNILIKEEGGEFPGGLVVRSWAFTAVAWVQSLIGELRSCKPHSTAKDPRRYTTPYF